VLSRFNDDNNEGEDLVSIVYRRLLVSYSISLAAD